MFQFIVAIISILLVAALAVASIYYGGTAYSMNSARAAAMDECLNRNQSYSKTEFVGGVHHRYYAVCDGERILLDVPAYLKKKNYE